MRIRLWLFVIGYSLLGTCSCRLRYRAPVSQVTGPPISMKRFSSSLIGIFVIGGLALATIGIIAFGGQLWFRDRELIAVYFAESTYGLERGSAVRLMGVRVGRVSSINVSYGEGGAVVQVICELDRSPLSVHREQTPADIRQRETLERMVSDGLQARLELIGITGMLFLELDFFEVDPDKTLVLEHPDYVVVPGVPSALAGLSDNLAEIARQLGEIDFAGIGESATRLMDTATRTIEEAGVKELTERLHVTVDNMNELLESQELRGAIAAAGQSFEDISRLAQRLESQVDPLAENVTASSEELQQTLRQASQTFSALQEMIGPRAGLGVQLEGTLGTIESAARSVERLADYLERNPQALVRGRGDVR